MAGAPGPQDGYHAWLRSLHGYRGQIASFGFFPPRRAEAARYAGELSPWIERLGISPYSHQAEAWELLEQGHDVVVATPTASGKSLVYQLPTLAALSSGGTALYLSPSKALAHDQLAKLRDLAAPWGVAEAVQSYDGDTPRLERRRVREQALCVLTNPDMLHYGILAYHGAWARLLGRLRLLVIDELHAYRGVMGSHVANILRRLLRLARHYGGAPRIVAASATIGNPAAHGESLTGVPLRSVVADGAPQPAREFIVWEPPAAEGGDGRRRSVNSEAAWLAARLLQAGVPSILFCNSRKSAELLRRYAVGQLGPEEATRLQSYRAGYTAEDRRLIEQGFRAGDISVLAATSALELGVDIGAVDAVVLVGYPGSLTALWQRAGRAGRAGRRALTLLIPGNDPLDEYYLRNPEALTEGRVEDAVVDPHNQVVHPLHVDCAAAELPLREEEGFMAPGFDPAARPRLYRGGSGWEYAGRLPHRRLAVRGTSVARVVLRDGNGRALGESDLPAALRDLHPGAVYLHQGESYLVARLDLEAGEATLLPHIEDFYTQARSQTEIEVLSSEPAPGVVTLGRVLVRSVVSGYVRKRYFSEAILDERPLDLPEVSFETQALWFSAEGRSGDVSAGELPGALHALEHALIGLLPAFVLCERADVGGVSYPHYPPHGQDRVFIYDGYPGGVGYARAGAERFPAWVEAARALLAGCPCRSGCPRCVLSPKCGNGNQVLDKAAALRLAEGLSRAAGRGSAALGA